MQTEKQRDRDINRIPSEEVRRQTEKRERLRSITTSREAAKERQIGRKTLLQVGRRKDTHLNRSTEAPMHLMS